MIPPNLVPILGDQPTSEYRNTSISKQTHFKETAAPVYPNNISTKNINLRLFMDFETSNEITTPRNTALRDTPENNTRGTLFLYCTSVEYLLITFDKRLRINAFRHFRRLKTKCLYQNVNSKECDTIYRYEIRLCFSQRSILFRRSNQ